MHGVLGTTLSGPDRIPIGQFCHLDINPTPWIDKQLSNHEDVLRSSDTILPNQNPYLYKHPQFGRLTPLVDNAHPTGLPE